MFFQINVTPEAKKPVKVPTENSEPPAVLVLAPFQPQTRIKIETIVNSPASSNLLIKNPGNRQLDVKVSKLPPDERKISINPWTLSIAPASQEELIISWTPKEVGSWRDTLQLIDSRRIKHDIAITTIANEAKKGQTKTKPKTRVLAPANHAEYDKNFQKTFTYPTSSSKFIIQENKENTVEKKCEKRSERKHFEVSSKPTEISGIFDISSFQLTPLKNDANRDKPTFDLKFSPCGEIISPTINHGHQLRRETFIQPNPLQEIKFSHNQEILSPIDVDDDDDGINLRRETYNNPNPKFCKLDLPIKEVTEESEDEEYRLLSPKPALIKTQNRDFSMLINNLANFITPIKSERLSINACSTGQKSNPDNSIANRTFEIDSSEVVNKNETFEFDKSPIKLDNCKLNRLAIKNFGEISPVKGDISLIPATPISSSPVSRYQYGENVSARDVLEADLWAKDQETEKSTLFRGKCKALGKIIEEQVTVTTKTFTRKVNFSSTSNQSAFCFEISPTKRINVKKAIKRISPIKSSKISRDKSILQHSVTKRKTIISTSVRKSPGGRVVPPVRIKKLSLAGLNKVTKPQLKETSVKLYDPNEIIFYNPDPFAATTTEDPFLANTLYYDEKWKIHQENEFKKWLNELLTPPEHLSTDVDSVKVDIGKVWQSSRLKDNVVLAETREAVSARYHTNTRLNTLRKAALAIFTRPEVRKVLSATAGLVERGVFVVRQDRDLNRDIGLQKTILELFLSYNPLWLRIGLEVIYGETIPLNSNNDLVGLTKFLLTRFFTDPYLQQKHSHPLTTLKLSTFLPNLNKFIVKKFLLIIYFLDYAKKNKLIGHDPCLYHKKATYKESREILLTFSRETLSGVGDITKILRGHGYVVTHKQTYLDEYDYAVENLSTDLRDGVRLCRVMELITGHKTLTCRCRVPAISRLQKIHNAELALTALREAGYIIAGDIDAKTIADGHREKTLSLLWQIIYKFQAPRFAKSATILQTWWRSKLWYVRTRNFLKNRKKNAAIVIQCAWKSFKARKLLAKLKNERQVEIKIKTDAVKIIQIHWRQRKIMLKLRNEFLVARSAAVVIQKWFRRLRVTRSYRQELQQKKNAVVVLQNYWRATRVMLAERRKHKNIIKSVKLIQEWWRTASVSKNQFINYQKLKAAVLFVQSKWRANKSMKIAKSIYLKKLKATKIIQTWWRSIIDMKKARNNFVIQKGAAKTIALWWIRLKLMESQRREFLAVKKSVSIIQRAWRRHDETKNDVLYFKKACKSSIVIQAWWQSVKAQKKYRIKRNSAIVIQRWFRATILKQNAQKDYKLMKKTAIMIQKTWKMKVVMRNYSKTRNSVIKIQKWYRIIKKSRLIRQEYLAMKKSAVCIQGWWRSLKQTWDCRFKYFEIKTAVIVIQKHWRAELLSRKETNEYQRIRTLIIKIQSQWRMIRERRNYLEKLKCQKAAIIIQRRWRAKKIGAEIQKYFAEQKSAVLVIQKKYRATIAARDARKKYLNLCGAAVKVQRRWRAIKLGKETQENYHQLRNACTCIQANWRMLLARRNFVKQKSACLIIQRKYRAIIAARKAKETYQHLLGSIIKIQRRWRANKTGKEAQENYNKIRNSAVVIQRKYRATIKTREVRNEYLKLHQAAVNLQRRWRAKKLGGEVRKNYQQLRRACICVQANWRMLLVRKQFIKQKNAVVIIQRRYRETIAAREVRQSYQTLQQITIKLQRIWRAKKIGRLTQSNYLQQRKACICIQKNWRMIVARKKYNKQRSAVLIIQRKYRATIEAREAKNKYLNLRHAAVKLQRRWRARTLAKKFREEYLQLHKASICLQSQWRMIRAQRNYNKIKKSVITLQTFWRMFLIARESRAQYLMLKKSIINMQRRYRAKMIGQKTRENYLKLRKSIITIQQQWRVKLHQEKREKAASIIQTWWQSIKLTQQCQINFKLKQKSIMIIQQRYRAYKIASKIHNDYKNLKITIIKIQRIWRNLCAIKRQNELAKNKKDAVIKIENWWMKLQVKRQMNDVDKQRFKKIVKAVILIQSVWRGYRIRKSQSPDIAKLRERSKKATETAHPASTVEYRLREAMDVMQNYNTVGHLSLGLACIDTLTRLSPSGCVQFCEKSLVETIYLILEESNRSLPWMDVCLRCANILITITKLPATSHYPRQIYYMETIARLMNATLKREQELFLHLATLLWLIAGDNDFAEEIINDQRTIWLIKSVCGTAMKHNIGKTSGLPTVGARRTMSVERTILLPNTRPDWGFVTKRPRIFTTIHHAISALMAKFRITQGFQ